MGWSTAREPNTQMLRLSEESNDYFCIADGSPSAFAASQMEIERDRSWIIHNMWFLALSCVSLKGSSPKVRRPAVWPTEGTLLSAGRPCLSGASWSALLRLASVRSHEAKRGVNGFGAFCRNKGTSPAGAKPGNTEHNADTKRELGVSQHLKNAFRKLFIDLGMTWNELGGLRAAE
jgi:hypothetical protein